MENLLQYLPQIILILLSLISIGINCYEIETNLIRYYRMPGFISWGFIISNPVLLYFGGFFHFSIPVFVYLILSALGIGIIFSRIGKVNSETLLGQIFAISCGHCIYYWGGFYDVFLK